MTIKNKFNTLKFYKKLNGQHDTKSEIIIRGFKENKLHI